ncbi:hypothetical protein H5410_025078 [Solanum commersonii]|uniref:Uncharacterized protein n=1 Tax=Solanum commersonii TaxID=4109 RepID=A0A9J5YT78_SOLCO|nr:hypothetical protein H5410_025078 [Solanum commersonii]
MWSILIFFHEFIEKFKDGASVMMPKIEKAKQIREAQNIASWTPTTLPRKWDSVMGGPKVNENEEFDDFVPSKPKNDDD